MCSRLLSFLHASASQTLLQRDVMVSHVQAIRNWNRNPPKAHTRISNASPPPQANHRLPNHRVSIMKSRDT